MTEVSTAYTMGPVDWLDRLYALTLRELKSFFYSPVIWVATFVFLSANGYLFSIVVELYSSQSNLPSAGSSHLFRFSLWLLMFLCPALSMHLLAAEWDNKSLEGLLTAPITEVQVVVSKFLGAFCFYMFMLLTMGAYLAVLAYYGNWEAGPMLCSFLGLFLIGGLFLSFGLFASSMTQSQLVAYLVTFIFNFIMTMGLGWIDRFLSNMTLREITNHIMIEKHFGDFTRGIIRTPPLVFYVSTITLFLFLAVRSVESRKWR